MNIQTYLPCFNGYYNSIFEANSEEMEIDHINEERAKLNLPEIAFEDCQWNYTEYYKEMSDKITDAIEGFIQEIYPSVKVKYESTQSPKEYNFTNDSINIELSIDETTLGKIRNYLLSHKEEFEKYLEKYTSCSGFISHYSNDPYTWIKTYWMDIRTNGHYLGSILEFILENELEVNDLKIYDNILDYPIVQADNYDDLLTLVIN